jgi:MFS family permease
VSGPSSSAVAAGKAGLLVAFMWGAYFLNYCDRQAVFSMTGSLEEDLGMTDAQMGLVGACFLWVYAFGCPIAGQVGDRFSKRLLVVASLVIWSLVTVANGFAGTALTMLGLRAAMGISESLFMPTAVALTANAHPPERRSRAIATLTTAQIAGTVGGSWFGGWMADRGEWRAAFFIMGAVGVLYAVPYFLFLRGVEEGTPEGSSGSGGGVPAALLAKIPTFLMLCFVFPVFVFGLWLLYGWLPTFLREKFALTQAAAALNATISLQATTAVGLLGGGFLADALYRRTKASRLWLMTASLLLSAPCLHYLGNSESLASTRAAAAGFGLFSGLLMGNIFPAAFEVVPAGARASAVGWLNFFGAIMSGFATLFGGRWKASLGIDALLTCTSFAYLAAAVVLVLGIALVFPRDHARAAPAG